MAIEQTGKNPIELAFADQSGADINMLQIFFDKSVVDEKPKPVARPPVGAGSVHSDIIRDGHEGDIRFLLGPNFRRGDVEPTAPDVAGPHVAIDTKGASDQFVNRMRTEMDKLPPNVRRLLSENNMHVVVADELLDAAPDLKGVHPRGWPDRATWENDDGAFRPAQRQILVTETYKDLDGKELPTRRAEGVLHHETGHAVDACLDNYSQNAEFKSAYDQDVANMPTDAKEKLKYLLQPDGAGQQETFAEVFAALQGSSANSDQTALILQSFPAVSALMKRKLASI